MTAKKPLQRFMSFCSINKNRELKYMLWGAFLSAIISVLTTHIYYVISGNELNAATDRLIAETNRIRKISIATQVIGRNDSGGAASTVENDDKGDPTSVGVNLPGGVGEGKGFASGGGAVGSEPKRLSKEK